VHPARKVRERFRRLKVHLDRLAERNTTWPRKGEKGATERDGMKITTRARKFDNTE